MTQEVNAAQKRSTLLASLCRPSARRARSCLSSILAVRPS